MIKCRHCGEEIYQDNDGGELYWTHAFGFVACGEGLNSPVAEPA